MPMSGELKMKALPGDRKALSFDIKPVEQIIFCDLLKRDFLEEILFHDNLLHCVPFTHNVDVRS